MALEISDELRRQGITQTKLAEGLTRAGHRVSAATLSRNLSGTYPLRIDRIEAIGAYLGLEVSVFTERTDAA